MITKKLFFSSILVTVLFTLLFIGLFYWFFIVGYTAGAINDMCTKEAKKFVGDEWTKILSPTEAEKKIHPEITGMPWGGREYRSCIYAWVEKIRDPILKFELTDTL